MHRREEYWGPDGEYLTWPPRSRLANRGTAQEYDPDRFLDDRVNKYLTPNPFIFLPFNAGPRICLGQQVCPYIIFFSACSPLTGRVVRVQRDVVLPDQALAALLSDGARAGGGALGLVAPEGVGERARAEGQGEVLAEDALDALFDRTSSVIC